MFAGGQPGIVIAWQQKVGVAAAERTFQEITNAQAVEDVTDAANLLAMTTMGTAYHTFAQHQSDEVMFRRIKLPRMWDAETEHRTTQEELIDRAQTGLAQAAELASVIEEMVHGGRSPELVSRRNLMLGRSLATTGVTLAVIKDRVAYLHLYEAGMHESAMQAAHGAYEASLDLTNQLGVRPTLAQLADDRSPLMQHLSNDPESVSQPVYETLVSEVAVAEDQALRK
jgi:hypothetical protein